MALHASLAYGRYDTHYWVDPAIPALQTRIPSPEGQGKRCHHGRSPPSGVLNINTLPWLSAAAKTDDQ